MNNRPESVAMKRFNAVSIGEEARLEFLKKIIIDQVRMNLRSKNFFSGFLRLDTRY